MNREKIIADFRKFFKSIKTEDRVAVIHHTDPDGVCSAVIAAKIVERLRGKKIDLRHNQRSDEHSLKKQTIHLLRSKKINKIIFTDLSIDEVPAPLKEIEHFADILILDHHKIFNDISSNKTTFINSSFISDVPSAQYCTAKLVYDLGQRLMDLSDLDWVAAVGCIGDMGGRTWHAWLANVFKKYGIKQGEDWFRTPLGKVSAVLSAAESYNDRTNVPQCFKIVYEATSYKDVMKSRLIDYKRRIELEINKWLRTVEKKAIVKPHYILYFVVPKYNIKAPLSTILSLKYPNKTVIVYELRGSSVFVSSRRRDNKEDMSLLMKNATKGLAGASAGGHIPAAGATVHTANFKVFLKKLTNLLEHQN